MQALLEVCTLQVWRCLQESLRPVSMELADDDLGERVVVSKAQRTELLQ